MTALDHPLPSFGRSSLQHHLISTFIHQEDSRMIVPKLVGNQMSDGIQKRCQILYFSCFTCNVRSCAEMFRFSTQTGCSFVYPLFECGTFHPQFIQGLPGGLLCSCKLILERVQPNGNNDCNHYENGC